MKKNCFLNVTFEQRPVTNSSFLICGTAGLSDFPVNLIELKVRAAYVLCLGIID